MINITEEIIRILRQELEVNDVDNNYSQWLLGISIHKPKSKRPPVDKSTYTARVILKTSTSPYLDGMDINFEVDLEQVQIDPQYYENTAELQGGTEKSSIQWLQQLGEVKYIQLENPYKQVGDDNDSQ